MITLQRALERLHTVSGGQETWQSFRADRPAAAGDDGGFRSLVAFREEHLSPGSSFHFETPRDQEILTYVLSGALMLDIGGGKTVVMETGECHRSAAKPGTLQRGQNGSLAELVRVFQFVISPDRKAVQTPAEKRRFPLAERRGILRLLVSRNGRDASLRIRQDVCIYSSVLDSGHHLVHELAPERGAWLHVVSGRVQLADHLLDAGDEASLLGEVAVSMTARGPSEILLLDLI